MLTERSGNTRNIIRKLNPREVREQLLGPDLEIKNTQKKLIAIIVTGDIKKLNETLTKGVNPQEKLDALFYAAEKNDVKMLEMLLEHKNFPRFTSEDQGDALLEAIENKSLKVINHLLKRNKFFPAEILKDALGLVEQFVYCVDHASNFEPIKKSLMLKQSTANVYELFIVSYLLADNEKYSAEKPKTAILEINCFRRILSFLGCGFHVVHKSQPVLTSSASNSSSSSEPSKSSESFVFENPEEIGEDDWEVEATDNDDAWGEDNDKSENNKKGGVSTSLTRKK